MTTAFSEWTSLDLPWATLVPAWAPRPLPARFETPGDVPWTYAAVSGVLDLPPGPDWAVRIQVSEVTGTLALAVADGEGQDGKRFMTLPAQPGPYWMSAPMALPRRAKGNVLILHGLANGGGGAVIHGVEVRKLGALPFEAWAQAWRSLGRAVPA